MTHERFRRLPDRRIGKACRSKFAQEHNFPFPLEPFPGSDSR